MAYEPKTKPTDASVEAFLDAVEHPGRREDGKVVAAMLAEVSGEKPVLWGPSIVGYGSWKTPSGDWPIVGFSPRKANLVLYVLMGNGHEDDLLARLGPHKTGKSASTSTGCRASTWGCCANWPSGASRPCGRSIPHDPAHDPAADRRRVPGPGHPRLAQNNARLTESIGGPERASRSAGVAYSPPRE